MVITFFFTLANVSLSFHFILETSLHPRLHYSFTTQSAKPNIAAVHLSVASLLQARPSLFTCFSKPLGGLKARKKQIYRPLFQFLSPMVVLEPQEFVQLVHLFLQVFPPSSAPSSMCLEHLFAKAVCSADANLSGVLHAYIIWLIADLCCLSHLKFQALLWAEQCKVWITATCVPLA